MVNISFDEWAALYKADPVEFERRRKELIDLEILKAPIEHRDMLRVLQTECDAIRAVYDPLQSTIKMSDMMVDRLNKLKAPLTQLRQLCEDINEK